MSLGNNIINLRKKSGLSQEQLGEKINVTRQTISNWELEETSPNPEQLKLLSKVFNISIDELLDNEVKEVLVEKISNTERLSGIIIKILKGIGILFISFLIIDIIAFIIFASTGKLINVKSSATTVCKMNDEVYTISFGTDNYFSCDNCTKEMNRKLEKLVDLNNIDKSISKINEYFIENNGTCD